MTRPRAVALALLFAGATARAQAPALLRGSVRDSASGEPLEDARVTAGPGHATTTDAAGRYTIAGLAPGAVLVRVQRFGYHVATASVTLVAGDSSVADFALRASPIGVAPVVVTAGKRSQLIDQVVASVAVVSDTDIARRAAHTVDEAIDKAPGVQLLNGQVNIRGSSGYVQGLGARVLVLVDGVPANEGDRGGIDWDLLPVDQIERVEIVKGAGSALYGSAALGGVINLITRDPPSGWHARVRATGGMLANPPETVWRFRDYTGAEEGLDASASYGTDAIRAGLTAGGRHSDGYREQDRSDHWEMVGAGSWQPSPATRVRALGSWASHQYQDPLLWCVSGECDTQGQAYQPFKIDVAQTGAYTRSDKGLFAATLEHVASPELSWRGRASWLRTSFSDRRSPAGDFGVANAYGLEGRGVVRPARSTGRTVTVGAELAVSDITSDVFGSHSQDVFAAYGETEERLWGGPARATVGARVDYLAVDGGGLSAVVSPRVGLVLPRDAMVWRASVGRGFRAPSLAERYASTALGGIRVTPCPSCGPETAWSFELGNTAQLGVAVRTDAALFWTEARHLIEPVVTDSIQFENVQRARLAGLDLALYASPFTSHLTTSVAYTLLYSRELAHDSVPSQPLAFRPTHLLTLGADYARGAFTVGGDFRFMSRFARVDLFPSDPRVAPKVLDLRGEYRRGGGVVRLLATNALDYIYNLAPRTLAPVRSVSVTLTWSY